jgi:hypothetical protein
MWNQEQMYDRIVKLLENSKFEVFAFLSEYTLTLTTDEQIFQTPKKEARKRGVKLRYVTEITKDNLSDCKKQLDMVDELRHLGRISGNFLMNESEFMASQEISARHPITEGFYTDIKKLVKLQGYVFETLWENAIPAHERIKQIEATESYNRDNSVYEVSQTEEEKKQVIDRFYVCPKCRSTSIFAPEAEQHSHATGHGMAKEFPFFDK